MKEQVSSMILLKQKSTVAIALSIANDERLAKYIINKNIPEEYYNKLISDIKENTLYKNIWIQILDKNATSIYRSWSEKRGDNLFDIRKDLVDIIKSKKVTFLVSVGKFDFSTKAIIPVFLKEEFVGIIEVISHFNSISNQLKKSQIDSVVVLKKEYKNQLKDPFTNIFIDEYYVANFDAPKHMLDYLKTHGIENYFNDSYKVENGHIIVSYELRDSKSNVLGYYIMSKKINIISDMDLEFFMFKWIAFGIIILLSITTVVSTSLFYANRKQRKYYKNIIDSSTNIVVVTDGKTIIDVNENFFKYFNYKSLKEFQKKYNCICSFFVEEDGYLKKDMDGVIWIEYLLNNPNKFHKVKINISDKEYYFAINAVLISIETGHYSVTLTDITAEENYKKELEELTITDSLTGVLNRRYFQKKLEEETSRARRYELPLSLIMFDIDYFKSVNDKYGHNVGDDVLKEYTKIVLSLLRSSDIFCRIGGEEFIIILPHTNKENAKNIAEKLRITVESSKVIIPITISFGVVEYKKGEKIDSIFKRADNALYKAKESGRNRVEVG